VTPEFSRRERLDAIGERERTVSIVATSDERAALAKRFGLLAIDRLSADFSIRRVALAAGIEARGHVVADVVQPCIATGEPVPAKIDESVILRFVDDNAPTTDEIELNEGDLDTLPIEDGAIDLGEAAAETLALALDPFPRSPDAETALKEAGVLGEGDVRPAGALAGLKAVLEKR
jgi:uncharacterized metal-binding protein YceD (DUF177 family)